MKDLGEGAPRSGGECDVPLAVWRTPAFQSWYAAHRDVGNRLDGAHVLWSFRVGPKGNYLFLWALHVDVWIRSEDRHKVNEFVLGRPDIGCVVAYHKPDLSAQWDGRGTEIVLVREFRSPGVTTDGFIHELPGGSSWTPSKGSPAAQAAEEFNEETGMTIDPSRLRYIGARQVAGTLCSHRAHVMAVELTAAEMFTLKASADRPHGNAEDSERTYVEVVRLNDLLACSGPVDWANLGMICAAMAARTR